MKTALRALVAVSFTAATVACDMPAADGGAGGARTGEVTVSVAPLTLAGVVDACYTLTVRNADGEPMTAGAVEKRVSQSLAKVGESLKWLAFKIASDGSAEM